jgi:hypothetical protein
MRALSIQQPWAWLIVNGYKDIENRSWHSSYRGPVLIHTGKNLDEDFWFYPFIPVEIRQQVPQVVDLTRGGIVGYAEIVDCVTDSESPWFFGKYGFVLRNARPLTFFPCKGKLGFFEVEVPEGYVSA